MALKNLHALSISPYFMDTIFTQTQDDSNVRQPTIKHICQGKIYLSKSKLAPVKNETSSKKKYFALNFICQIHKHCPILSTFTNQCHCPSPHSVPSSSSHSLLPCPFSALPFHNVSSVPSALDIQHLLNPFTFTFVERHCHAVLIQID